MKLEIRVLGLDACSGRRIVAVVTRGGLYMDGLVVFENDTETAVLARGVTQTKYFPELRAIMVHGSALPINTRLMHAKTGLPIIEVSTDVSQKKQGYKTAFVDSRRLLIRTAADEPDTQRMLALTMRLGGLPEPLRIAHLLGNIAPLKGIKRDKL